ncbi:MAG: chalcone isomerase family protein [Betaproteobacteria bacterium]|nr:chalcone isomerase family protein [Betaproteobacteria bacterium]
MKKLLLVLLLLSGLAQAASDVAGVKYEDKIKFGPSELTLNGVGVRARFFIKVYTIGLYLTEKKTTAAEVLALKGAKRLHIVTLRDLSAEDFAAALVGGIHKNHTDAEVEPLKAGIEEFKEAILSVKNSSKGDAVSIDWLPESGTRLSINGKQLGKDIAGEDFYRALLRIWLGSKPAQDDLKEALLGKPN